MRARSGNGKSAFETIEEMRQTFRGKRRQLSPYGEALRDYRDRLRLENAPTGRARDFSVDNPDAGFADYQRYLKSKKSR